MNIWTSAVARLVSNAQNQVHIMLRCLGWPSGSPKISHFMVVFFMEFHVKFCRQSAEIPVQTLSTYLFLCVSWVLQLHTSRINRYLRTFPFWKFKFAFLSSKNLCNWLNDFRFLFTFSNPHVDSDMSRLRELRSPDNIECSWLSTATFWALVAWLWKNYRYGTVYLLIKSGHLREHLANQA